MPHIMKDRHDGQNIAKSEVRCEPFDEFIKAEREKGNRFNYMHLVIAGIVRTFALKPRLNRFIMNGRIYKRKGGIFHIGGIDGKHGCHIFTGCKTNHGYLRFYVMPRLCKVAGILCMEGDCHTGVRTGSQ